MSELLHNKRTVLYNNHRNLNATMTNANGFEMPLYFNSVSYEHRRTREHVTIFDRCNVGIFRISGITALSDLENLVSCSIDNLKIGQGVNAYMFNDDGKILDELYLCRLDDKKYIIIASPSQQRLDFEWISRHISQTTRITDISDFTANIEIQGPLSIQLINHLIDNPLEEFNRLHFKYCYYRDTRIMVIRGGCTGEIGFEIMCPFDIASTFWNDCINNGAIPAGIGCRESLRIEMGYPLFGHEFDSTHFYPEYVSLVNNFITVTKNFIGSKFISQHMHSQYTLHGLLFNELQTPATAGTVFSPSKEKIGRITSSTFSHTIQKSIALCLIHKEHSEIGKEIYIEHEKRKIIGKIVSLPFYACATVTLPFSNFPS